MQIFHWLFKAAREEQEIKTTINKTMNLTVEETEPQKLVVSKTQQNNNTEETEITYRTSDCFAVLPRRNAGEIFCHSLNLKRLKSLRRRQQEEGIGKMDPKVDTHTHIGNMISPICNSTPIVTNYQYWPLQKKYEMKRDNNKVILRMKELWRWAAIDKSDKEGKSIFQKVSQFHNRGTTTNGSKRYEQWNLSSPHMSFRWETYSCYKSDSFYSVYTLPSSVNNGRKWIKPCSSNSDDNVVSKDRTPRNGACSRRSGNWIHTDDEFVVLEL